MTHLKKNKKKTLNSVLIFLNSYLSVNANLINIGLIE